MSIANRIMATQNQITAQRRNNPVVLSPMQQQLADALAKKEELLFLLAHKPSEEETLAQLTQVEEQLELVKHDKAVLCERLKLRAASKATTTTTKQTTGEKQMWTAPKGMDPVLAAIMKFQMEEQNQ